MKIYTLSNTNGEIKYVGVTRNTLNQRLSQHICAAKKHKGRYVCNWINSLLRNDEKPIITLIDEVDDTDWGFWEEFYIELMRAWGFDLTNTAKGGAGVVTSEMRTKESMKRSSDKHKKSIYQLDDDFNIIKEWDSSADARRYYNLKSAGSVSNSLIYGWKSNGYRWCLKDKYNEYKDKYYKNNKCGVN